MATTSTNSWQSIALTKNQVFKVRKGSVRFHSLGGTSPGENDGMHFAQGDSIAFQSGQTIHYRNGVGNEGLENTFDRIDVEA